MLWLVLLSEAKRACVVQKGNREQLFALLKCSSGLVLLCVVQSNKRKRKETMYGTETQMVLFYKGICR